MRQLRAVSLKIAQEADLDTLLELMKEYYEYDQLAFDEAQARAGLKQMLPEPSLGRIWLIYERDQIIGYLVLTLDFSLEYGRGAFIDEFYLRAGHRGRGIGTQAIHFAQVAARELGVQVLYLEVERKNMKALAFYKKHGFEDHDRYLLSKKLW